MEFLLRIEKNGIVYLRKRILAALRARPGDYLILVVEGGQAVLKRLPTPEELFADAAAKLTPEEAEKMVMEELKSRYGIPA